MCVPEMVRMTYFLWVVVVVVEGRGSTGQLTALMCTSLMYLGSIDLFRGEGS
jgi:hypothetical protein